MSESAKLEEELKDIPADLLSEIKRVCSEGDKEVYISRLLTVLEGMGKDKRRPFLEEEGWSPQNDWNRFQNLKLSPERLSIAEVLAKGYVAQAVQIMKDFTATFRSSMATDLIFLSSWIHLDNEKYARHKDTTSDPIHGKKADDSEISLVMDIAPNTRSLKELAIYVTHINGVSLGKVDDINVTNPETGVTAPSLSLAKKKLEELKKLPEFIIQDLLLHLRAFEIRVAKEVYNVDSVKAF